jgi:tetratricopeptide (TPR) repeat protein
MKFRRRHQKELDRAISHAGRLLSERRDHENLDFLEEAVQSFPDSAEIQLLYATALLASQPDAVASEATKAVDLSPNDPLILVRAASLLLNRGKTEAARLYTERARQLVEPDFVLEGGLARLEGVFAAFEKKYDLAEEKLRFAVETDPEFDTFVRDLARLLQTRGRRAEAVEVIDQALPRVKKKSNLERLRRELLDSDD